MRENGRAWAIIRLIVTIALFINCIAVLTGIYGNDLIAFVSVVFSLASVVWSWWKNNNVTYEAVCWQRWKDNGGFR